MITKLIKGRGINYKGGREFHDLIVERKMKMYKSPFDIVDNWVKYPSLESR